MDICRGMVALQWWLKHSPYLASGQQCSEFDLAERQLKYQFTVTSTVADR